MTFTFSAVIIIIVMSIIITFSAFAIGAVVKTASNNTLAQQIATLLSLFFIWGSTFLITEVNKVTSTSSKTYQLKLNSEGHTQYSVKSGQGTAYDTYKVTTDKNKIMTVYSPDNLVYNKTNKSKLTIKTTNDYLLLFGYKIKMIVNETQTLYIIK